MSKAEPPIPKIDSGSRMVFSDLRYPSRRSVGSVSVNMDIEWQTFDIEGRQGSRCPTARAKPPPSRCCSLEQYRTGRETQIMTDHRLLYFVHFSHESLSVSKRI